MTTLYDLTVPQFEKTLTTLEHWMDKAIEFAKSKNFEPDTLLSARLAPDMFPLVRQIQSVCDQTKFVCARLTAKEVPPNADTEKTFEELRSRIRSTKEVLKSFKPSDFDGAEARRVTLSWMPGKYIVGKDYLVDFALPNFYFHLTTTYNILRHNGVVLGKPDFIGGIPFKDA